MTGERRGISSYGPTWAARPFDHGDVRPIGVRLLQPEPQLSPRPPDVAPVLKIGRQWYRQFDNGRANVLVPTADPWASPAELAARRAALERVFYMADNPLAGVGYAIATLAGASPQTRDKAMVAGGSINTVLAASAPLGARSRIPVRPPTPLPTSRTVPRAPIRYGQASASGQASYGGATFTKPMLDTGKRVKRGLVLPGLLDPSTWDRGHLIPERLGGAARSLREAVALDSRVNRGPMASFEKAMIGRVRAGEIVEYFVKPLYGAEATAPSAVVMPADGSRGRFTPRVVQNPAGRRK